MQNKIFKSFDIFETSSMFVISKEGLVGVSINMILVLGLIASLILFEDVVSIQSNSIPCRDVKAVSYTQLTLPTILLV